MAIKDAEELPSLSLESGCNLQKVIILRDQDPAEFQGPQQQGLVSEPVRAVFERHQHVHAPIAQAPTDGGVHVVIHQVT